MRKRLFQPTRPVWGATFRSEGELKLIPLFQPTRPVWGATQKPLPLPPLNRSFNPRAPCGARLIIGA